MRKRSCSMHLRMTHEEAALLRKLSEKAGLGPQAYILSLIKNTPIREQPPMEFYDVLTALRRIGNNMNQIAARVNTSRNVDGPEYRKNIRELQSITAELLRTVKS